MARVVSGRWAVCTGGCTASGLTWQEAAKMARNVAAHAARHGGPRAKLWRCIT